MIVEGGNIMKLLKKIMPLILSASLYCAVPVLASSNFPNLDYITQEGSFVGIKKIEEKNGIVTSKDIENPSNIRNLKDGVYIVNRGTGWIINEEENYLTSSVVQSGTSSTIETSKSITTTHTAIAGSEVELNYKFARFAIEVSYEHAVSNEETIAASFEVNAPRGKDLYVKLYSTHARYDMIKVENGEIVEHSATYVPEGTWAKVIEHTPGSNLNLGKFEEKVTRCVLGEMPIDSIKNIISINGVVINPEKGFDLALDYNSEEIQFFNRSNNAIHLGFGEQKYLKFSLLDSSMEEKSSFEFKGSDKPSDSKYNELNGLQFEIGDYILIEHTEPFRVEMFDYDGEGVRLDKSQKMLFKITEDGLKQEEATEEINEEATEEINEEATEEINEEVTEETNEEVTEETNEEATEETNKEVTEETNEEATEGNTSLGSNPSLCVKLRRGKIL